MWNPTRLNRDCASFGREESVNPPVVSFPSDKDQMLTRSLSLYCFVLFRFVTFCDLGGCGNLSRVLLEFGTPCFVGLVTMLFDGWVSIEVEMPNTVTSSSITYTLSGMWFGVVSRTDTKKKVFTIDWTLWSKCDNCLKFHNQHDWRDLYDCLVSAGIFTLMMKKEIHTSYKKSRGMWLRPQISIC